MLRAQAEDRSLPPVVLDGLTLEAQVDAKKMVEAERSGYSQFRKKYRDDPVGFARDCIKWEKGDGLAPYQEEILSLIPQERRVAVRGPHGLGKTMVAAIAVLWFSLTRDVDIDWKVVTTASSWRQLTHYLWPEIRKWRRYIKWNKVKRPFLSNAEALTLNLKMATGEAFPVASTIPELIEGAHASSLLYVFDEAKAIPSPTWDAVEGALSVGDCFALAISTPGQPQGRFYDIHSHKPGYEDWHTRHITLEEAIDAGRIDAEWADQRWKQWGEDSAVYQNRVLGEFASSGDDNVIPLMWVELANQFWQEWNDAGCPTPSGARVLGVDVARMGSDSSCIAERIGDCILKLEKWGKTDTMETAGRVKVQLKPGTEANVDVIGIGAGVVDRLREQGEKVVAVNFGAGTKRTDTSGEVEMLNVRAAAWWGMRELLEPPSYVMLPPDDELTGDLVAPRYGYTSSGKLKVESKIDIRKRLGRSPDVGDAVVLAFWKDEKPPLRSIRSLR